MAGQLSGAIALVTGAAGGIGAATAIAFAREGAHVVVSDRAAPEGVADDIRAAGGNAVAVTLDVTDGDAVEATLRAIIERHGRIDIAFNNAGVSLEDMQTPWDDLDRYDRVVSVNQRGVMLCMVAELRHMAARGRGSIVNTASIAGLSGAAGAGYCGSKHAVVGLTRSAALRYASTDVRVNAVCPGVIETPMTRPLLDDPDTAAVLRGMVPMGRIARPEEVAAAVLFLASDAASFVTGHALAVDGGFLAQ